MHHDTAAAVAAFAVKIICTLLLTSTQSNSYSWTEQQPHGNTSVEYRLKQHLMRGYDVTSRPVRQDATAVDTKVGVSLFHILDTNELHQTISALLSIRVHWWDEYLQWETDQFPVKKIWIPAKSIWRPDLIITNYANDEYSDYMNTNGIVSNNGKVMWTFPIVVKMYCTLDVRYFPFDTQDCTMTFMSWTYDGFQLALNHSGKADQKVYFNPRNQEWMVTQIIPDTEVKKYPCCDEPFPALHFVIHMYRRSLFYVINLICPCLLIYFVSFLGFFLPIESGEKVNLEITVLLALVVFLLMVSETMPPTPDAIPILGLLFSMTMVMVALAVVMAVTVTQVFFSQSPQELPPAYIRRLSRAYRRWRRAPIEQRLRAQRGIARLRRVEVDAASLGSLDIDLPPSATYFKDALRSVSGNGFVQQQQRELQHPHYHHQEQQQQQQFMEQQQQAGADKVVGDYAEEWRTAAFALDRIFFWLFCCLTAIVFAVVCYVARPAFFDDRDVSIHV